MLSVTFGFVPAIKKENYQFTTLVALIYLFFNQFAIQILNTEERYSLFCVEYFRNRLQLGGEGAAPSKQKFCPFKQPSMPTQIPLSLAAVSRWWLFLETNQELGEK